MTTLEFSQWSKWDNRESKLKDELQHRGIYALRISKSDLEGQPFDLVRDIVYFGMTNSVAGLKGRLSQFNNTLRDKSGSGHGGADRFRNDYESKEEAEELANTLYVAVWKFICGHDDTPENLRKRGDVAKAEYEAFAEYVARFTELPKYNNRKSEKLSKRKLIIPAVPAQKSAHS